jgi:Hemerythrin HHE cation binding domain
MPVTSDVAELLVEHAHFRCCCAQALELARTRDATHARALAAQLLADADGRLELHLRDEAESIAPRLEPLCDPDVAAALDMMLRAHAQILVLLSQLCGEWRAILLQPTPERCAASAELAIELGELMARHLDLEEKRIFPALAQLPPGARAAIAAEGRCRRGLAGRAAREPVAGGAAAVRADLADARRA